MDAVGSVRIARIRVKNFLSLKNIDIELGKLNVFVGPNASGKSNVVKVLQLLANHARNGIPSLPGYGTFMDIVHGFDPYGSVSIELDAVVDGRSIRYFLTMTADDYLEKIELDGKIVLECRGTELYALVLTNDGGMVKVKRDHLGHARSALFTHELYKSILFEPPTNVVREIHALSRALKSIGTYSFSPNAIRARSRIESIPMLGYHGENLPRVLLHLFLEDRKRFALIEETLKNLVPEVEEIVPHLEGTYVELRLRVKGLSEPLKPANISDGTLRILAYVTALYTSSTLVAFEEPENCIHPHLLETLIDLARKAPCQVVVTTHSPHLLDHVEPDEVYVVEKRGTETVLTKLTQSSQIKAVKKFLSEGGTLGEAWYSGLMGGAPG